MRVFVSGGSEAAGRQLVPNLPAEGHEVVVTALSSPTVAPARASGANLGLMDRLDAASPNAVNAPKRPLTLPPSSTAVAETGVRSLVVERFPRRTNERDGSPAFITQAGGLSTAEATSVLDWSPCHARRREGFRSWVTEEQATTRLEGGMRIGLAVRQRGMVHLRGRS
jgi:hypothetical protein